MSSTGSDFDGALPMDMLVASLSADSSDNESFFEVLAVKLGDTLGPRMTQEREGGLRHRDHRVKRVSIVLGDDELEATRDRGRIVWRLRHTVRGVVLRNQELDAGSWLQALLEHLAAEAQANASTRAALESLLT
ncbi:MAG: hypothetical protein ACRD0I_05615 [Acidimicrobiales bacterium]